jgi:hypothetical protein
MVENDHQGIAVSRMTQFAVFQPRDFIVTRVVIPLILLFILPLAAQARQYSTHEGGKDHVVHSRKAPVVVHRALPPFKGQHVYEGRVEK